MDQRVFIKKCGRDQLGNTRMPDLPGRPGREFLENEVEVAIFSAAGVYEMRGPSLNKKTAEVEYKFSVDEVIADHAKVIADGRPYFIGTVNDMPEDGGVFRGAWFYDDETDPQKPRIAIDIDVAREIQRLRIKDFGSMKMRKLDMFAPDIEEKKKAIIDACINFDLSGINTMSDLRNAFPPEVL